MQIYLVFPHNDKGKLTDLLITVFPSGVLSNRYNHTRKDDQHRTIETLLNQIPPRVQDRLISSPLQHRRNDLHQFRPP